jgi:hypothetical protein
MSVKSLVIYRIALMLAAASFPLFSAARLETVQGDVQVRRGVEEKWSPAAVGINLEDIDTILTLEGNTTLKLADGAVFKLGPNSILDIDDLRRISRQEMFLLLMSQKVQDMKPRERSSNLEVENISSVHGQQKTTTPKRLSTANDAWKRGLNAARAMYQQRLYPNSVVKLHKLLSRYEEIQDCGEVFLYLGKSFEALDERGQAIDYYQSAAEKGGVCENGEKIVQEAQQAQLRLSK